MLERSTTILCFAAFLVTSAHLHAAELVSLKNVQTKKVALPQGQAITLSVTMEDLIEGDQKKKAQIASLLDAKKVTFTYTIAQEQPKSASQTTPGPWTFEIAALKPLSKVGIEIRLEAAPNMDRVVDEVLRDQNFGPAIDAFFNTATGTDLTTPIFQDALKVLGKSVQDIVTKNIPEEVRSKEAPKNDIKLLTPIVNLKGDWEKLGELRDGQASLVAFRSTLTKETLEKKYTGTKRQLVDKFISTYDASKNSFAQYLRPNIEVDYKSTVAVQPSDAQAEDFKRYAGVDFGAIYTRSTDELRKAVLVSIYFGGINDQPYEFSKSEIVESLRQRFSLTIGYDLGDISGNPSSDVKGNNAYFVGLGYRLNKYFRLEAGKTLARSESSGGLKSHNSIGVSVDLTGFQILQGLVSNTSSAQ